MDPKRISNMDNLEEETSLLESLPAEVLNEILHNLTVKDVINLAATSKSLCVDIYDLGLRDLYEDCRDEIDEEFRGNRPVATEHTAKHGHNEWGYECFCVKRSWGQTEAYMDWHLKCSVFEGQVHRCRISYIRNPRDVDLIGYYVDDKEFFSAMF